jgi:osmotically-inducible protein OsmY
MVVLSGQVNNLATKRAAEQDAFNTVGVTNVANRARIVADLQIKYGIKNRMYWSGYMDSREITIQVDKGVVQRKQLDHISFGTASAIQKTQIRSR